MNGDQQSVAIVTEETLLTQHATKPIYQKPKASLFLEPRDIQGGSENVPESNSGLLQS